MQRYGFLHKTPNVPQSFLLQRYDYFLESQLLKSSKILVIFFQNTEFCDEMGRKCAFMSLPIPSDTTSLGKEYYLFGQRVLPLWAKSTTSLYKEY